MCSLSQEYRQAGVFEGAKCKDNFLDGRQGITSCNTFF